MINEELLGFIKNEHDRLIKFYGFTDKKQMKYPNTIKLMEEAGELAQEILASESIQRREKLSGKNEIGNEVADVIITALIIAENNDIDINSELKKAIEKRNSRKY